MKSGPPAKSVAAYLAAVPKAQRAALQALRRTIKAAAPGGTEVISYHIPTYRHEGHGLVAFAAFTNHCSLFVMSKGVTRDHEALLVEFPHVNGTIRFTPEKPLPLAVVRKIVRARVAENRRRWPVGGMPKRKLKK